MISSHLALLETHLGAASVHTVQDLDTRAESQRAFKGEQVFNPNVQWTLAIGALPRISQTFYQFCLPVPSPRFCVVCFWWLTSVTIRGHPVGSAAASLYPQRARSAWGLASSWGTHSPWWAGVRILKLSCLSLRWDSSKMEFTLQSSPQDQAKTGLCQKSHHYLAFSSFLPCLAYPLPVSPGNMSLINHLHMNLYLSVCLLVTLPKARSNSIIKREIA